MGETQTHGELVNSILVYPKFQTNGRFWKQHVGIFETPNGMKIKIGISGMADITGVWNGRRVEIECKVKKDYQKPEQKLWQQMIERFGGLYILARSIEDVERGLGVS